MGGRAWYDGAVKMDVTLYGSFSNESLNLYVGGIMDTLDGSHGQTFTYLPVVYQDDCQVFAVVAEKRESDEIHYRVEITFL